MKAKHFDSASPQKQSVSKRAEAPVWTVSYSREIVFPVVQGGLTGKDAHGWKQVGAESVLQHKGSIMWMRIQSAWLRLDQAGLLCRGKKERKREGKQGS